MTTSSNPAKLILSILKERGIPVQGNEVTGAFDNATCLGKNAEWMMALDQDSLLSQEELALYTTSSLSLLLIADRYFSPC